MRQLIAILLLAVHVLGNTELGQILRLPKLVHHFNQHKKEKPDLSLISFVTMHYGGDDGNIADDAEDNQLPFHQIQNTHFHFTATIQPIVSVKSRDLTNGKTLKFPFKNGIAKDTFLDGLFRPPLA